MIVEVITDGSQVRLHPVHANAAQLAMNSLKQASALRAVSHRHIPTPKLHRHVSTWKSMSPAKDNQDHLRGQQTARQPLPAPPQPRGTHLQPLPS